VATVWGTQAEVEASADEAKAIAAKAVEVSGASSRKVESFEVAFAELLAPVAP
jgi:hypothetical protein